MYLRSNLPHPAKQASISEVVMWRYFIFLALSFRHQDIGCTNLH